MKAILEFNLPEDRIEHMMAVNAAAAWSTIHHIRNAIRAYDKHGITESVTLHRIKEYVYDLPEVE